GPIDRRVSAAHDQNPLVAELLFVLDCVKQALVLESLVVIDVELLGYAGARSQRQNNGLAVVLAAFIGNQLEIAVFQAIEADHLFAQADCRFEQLRLNGQILCKIFSQDLRVSGDIVDIFLGIQGRQLSTEFGEHVDHLCLHAPQTCIKTAKQPCGSASDNGDIVYIHYSNWVSGLPDTIKRLL